MKNVQPLDEVWDTLYYPNRKLRLATPIFLQEGAIIPFYKPLGWTSFDLVNKVRGSIRYATKIKKIKVGHAGTLDPQAQGVLLVCIGKATKRIEELMDHSKVYKASLRLGATTPSFDTEQEPDRFFEYQHITPELVAEACHSFEGDIEQIPPLFSAIQIDGRRAYDLARAGENVELPPKKVTIHEICIEHFELPNLEIRVHCSRGTYIRSLARDLGVSLSSGAYLTALERIQTGNIAVEDCLEISDLAELISMIRIPQEEADTTPNTQKLNQTL